GAGERAAAERLRDLLGRSRGPSLRLAPHGRIRFQRDSKVAGAEAYRIAVRHDSVAVTASRAAGLYYGAETLWQLMTTGSRIPALTIADQPAFAWRGVMLDSARHKQPGRSVKEHLARIEQ